MTETFAFTVAYVNETFTVSQPANGNLVFHIPLADSNIATHPSDADIFYFGSPSLPLNQTLITNIVPVSRAATIAYIRSLAIPGATPTNVAVTSLPSNALDAQGCATNTLAGNGNAIALRVIAGVGQYIKLRQLNAATALGLGTYTQIDIIKNPTPTGGTWSAAFPGSIVERNNLTGFSFTGGEIIWSCFSRSENSYDLTSSDPTFVNGDVLVVRGTFFLTTSLGVNLIWNESN